MKTTILVAAALLGGACATTAASAQVRNENPMGLDYGSFHPAVPSQVTTYEPEPVAVSPRRHHRVRRPAS